MLKTVVKRQWQKFYKIFYDDKLYDAFESFIEAPPVVILFADAEKILRYLAQHCKTVSGFTANDDFVILLLHQFKYKLDGFTVDHLQKLIAENATEIKNFML